MANKLAEEGDLEGRKMASTCFGLNCPSKIKRLECWHKVSNLGSNFSRNWHCVYLQLQFLISLEIWNTGSSNTTNESEDAIFVRDFL